MSTSFPYSITLTSSQFNAGLSKRVKNWMFANGIEHYCSGPVGRDTPVRVDINDPRGLDVYAALRDGGPAAAEAVVDRLTAAGNTPEKVALRGLVADVAGAILNGATDVRSSGGEHVGPVWAVARALELAAETVGVTGPTALAASENPDVARRLDGWHRIDFATGRADTLPTDGQFVYLSAYRTILGQYSTVGDPWRDRHGIPLPYVPEAWRSLDNPPPYEPEPR